MIVTVEEIVDSEVLRRNPDRTVLPGFRVDAVVEVPYGAHPTSFYPALRLRRPLPPGVGQGVARRRADGGVPPPYVLEPETQADYLEAVGGSARLMEVSRI